MEILSFLKNNIEFASLSFVLFISIIGFISSWAVNVHSTRKTSQELSKFTDMILEVFSNYKLLHFKLDSSSEESVKFKDEIDSLKSDMTKIKTELGVI